MVKELSGYKVSVEGQYFLSAGEGKKKLSRYEITVNLPSMENALAVLKGKILPKALPLKYPDYKGLRTYEIVNVEAFGNIAKAKEVLWQMNRPTIESFIRENELPVESYVYPTLMELREAVEMSQRDPDNFIRKQEAKERDYKLNTELMSLNPELYPISEEDTVPSTTKSKQKSKSKKNDAVTNILG